MPTAPLRVCPIPGCSARVDRNTRYCPDHLQAHHRRIDETRPTAVQRGYDATWARTRTQFLAAHPTCRACGRPATDVDHITRRTTLIDRGVRNPDHPRFLQALCHPCHSAKTARETWHT
jgi:5-methylcytosine-specific restriction enzyme A